MEVILAIALVLVLALSAGLFACRLSHANDIELEASMKPCPKCGHRAVTVYYNGENNPPRFSPPSAALICDATNTGILTGRLHQHITSITTRR